MFFVKCLVEFVFKYVFYVWIIRLENGDVDSYYNEIKICLNIEIVLKLVFILKFEWKMFVLIERICLLKV